MLDLAVALDAKDLSHRRAGEEVLAAWKKRERRSSYPTSAAIGAKIGLLAKGNRTWWRNHERALDALADVLACKPSDLLPTAEAGPALIGFPDFAEMAGLLPGQDPCAVNADGWLGTRVDAALHEGGRWWFLASPGSGKSLAVRVLRQRRGSTIVSTTTRTLAEAVRDAKDDVPIVIEVEHADPSTNVSALIELTNHHASVCVLAPFGRPQEIDGWTDHVWGLEPGWDERLIAWVQTRLPSDRRVDPSDILDWLDVIDPRRQVFETPGDLMPLIARASRAGLPTRKEGLSGFAREWLAQKCTTISEPWLRRIGPEVLQHLVTQHLHRVDLPATPLSISAWAELVPVDVLAPQPKAPSPRLAKKTSAATTTSLEPTSMLPVEVIHALADSGLLQTFEGHLDTFPRWVRVALERDVIVDTVKRGDTAWALWAVDESRHDLVDDAIDALTPTDLIKAISRVESDNDDLAHVAAIEALFSAVGRRMLNTTWRPTTEMMPTLQQLGLRQLRLLDTSPQLVSDASLVPLTRYRPNDQGWDASWLAEAWTFSVNVPRPPTAPEAAWQLPGWATDLRIAAAPSLPFPVRDAGRMLRLLRAARTVVERTSDEDLPAKVDLLLLPWIVIDGSLHRWKLEERHTQAFFGSVTLSLIGELLKGEPDHVCERAVTTAWPALLARFSDPFEVLRFLREQHNSFFDVVVEHVPLSVFEDAITGMKTSRFEPKVAALVALPERLRRCALRAVAQLTISTRHPIWKLDEVVAGLNHDDIDLLVEFAAERYSVGRAATSRVWELDPDRALAEALNALTKSAESKGWWFYNAPGTYLTPLLDEIRDLKPRPAWTRRWLATVLSRAGTQATRVFTMMSPKSQ